MSEQAVILGDLDSQDGAQLKMVLIIAEPEADSSRIHHRFSIHHRFIGISITIMCGKSTSCSENS